MRSFSNLFAGSEPMVEGSCQCCGSKLRFPSSVTCFRCTLCECVNDRVPLASNPVATAASRLSLRLLDDLMLKVEQGVLPVEALENVVERAFSSWECLNDSFGNDLTLSINESSINLADARTAYSRLIKFSATHDQNRLVRKMMSGIESLLRRPGRRFTRPQEVKFLILIFENPILAQHKFPQEAVYHHSLLVRLFGSMSNLSNEIHHYVVHWFTRYPNSVFERHIDLCNNFIAYRLTKEGASENYHHDWAIRTATRVMALLFAANHLRPLGSGVVWQALDPPPSAEGPTEPRRAPRSPDLPELFFSQASMATDPIGAATPPVPLASSPSTPLFNAQEPYAPGSLANPSPPTATTALAVAPPPESRQRLHSPSSSLLATPTITTPESAPFTPKPPEPFGGSEGPVTRLPLHVFYNTVVDYIDLLGDFQRWQEDRQGFAFCQYPFHISLGGKMKILDADAKRQMGERFKDAFIRTAIHGQVTDPFLSIHVRRNRLIEDSLNQLAVRGVDLKKRLLISFVNEEGVDAGGLTKEWFLLLVRDLFDEQYGMFDFDPDSNYCWFSIANSLDTDMEARQNFYLVGLVLGLGIYNSIILDVHFPLAVYKKLLGVPVSLDDLQVLHPQVGKSLGALLEYREPDLEDVFCLSFMVEYRQFGVLVKELLVPGGDAINVTQANKAEYVAKYVDWILNRSVETCFASFKDGFIQVTGGNALTLFRPEEIEMMVRGGKETDLHGLESATVYEGFSPGDPVVGWFWELVHGLDAGLKAKLLLFATGSDRIPATGIENMVFKISCLGGDSDRLPLAHTCFNQVCLWRYSSKAKLEDKLVKAIEMSSGFFVK